jgi:hypothetical protein
LSRLATLGLVTVGCVSLVVLPMYALPDAVVPTAQGAEGARPPSFSLTVEAKDFDVKSGGVLIDGGWQMSGTLSSRSGPRLRHGVTFPRPGTYDVDVIAKGVADGGVWPILGIFAVRGFAYAAPTVDSSEYRTYSIEVRNVPGGFVRDVEFALMNGSDGSPRSVTIDKVVIRAKPIGPSPTLTRGPILQNPDASPTTTTIVWWTDQPADSAVEYGTTAGVYTHSVGDREKVSRHVIKLSDLQPNTRYFYRTRSDGETLAEGSFRTFAEPNTGATVTFAVIGDFGNGSAEAQRVADRIAEHPPQLLLTAGDNVYPNLHYFTVDRRWLDVYGTAHRHAFLYPTWGNHDAIFNGVTLVAPTVFALPPLGTPELAEFQNLFYSFDVGDVHFTMLYGHRKHVLPGHPQTIWLRNDLADADRRGMRWKFVIMHNVPYGCGRVAQGNAAVKEHWAPIFEEFEVDAVFVGDSHTYARTALRDDFPPGGDGKSTRYIVTGAGGNPGTPRLRTSRCEDFVINSSGPIYVSVSVAGNTATLEAIGAMPDGRRAVLETVRWTKEARLGESHPQADN